MSRKPSTKKLTEMPSIRVTAVPERGIYAKAAGKSKKKLTEWCREAFREKLEREEPELYEKASELFGWIDSGNPALTSPQPYDELLGKKTDAEIAREFGVTTQAIGDRRRKLGINRFQK